MKWDTMQRDRADALKAFPGIKVYILLEFIIMALILWAQVSCPYEITGKIMYSAIVVNTVMAALFYMKRRSSRLVFAALLLTLTADWFLTLWDSRYLLGVLLFCLVQTAYAAALGLTLRGLGLRLGLFAAYMAALTAMGLTPLMALLEGYSIAMLTANVLTAWQHFAGEQSLRWLLLAAGLTLFMGCDLCVGLRNALWGMGSMGVVSSFCHYMIWVFYTPAQVMLTLSLSLDSGGKK